MPSDTRPDPDQLLARLAAREHSDRRGQLRLYFGASAGVGKTFAMLNAAHAELRAGRQVLGGLIETHGRAETVALLAGLPLLPLRSLEYRGKTLQEFDLDAALQAHPDLLLLDELAHSNLPGSRHARRWQDVDELLDAGIDVWTTLNAQHLESLNDTVGSITGVRVWETVPDRVFDSADEVILIDVPVDELLHRLRAGKVYMPAQAQAAGQNFFRKGNLIALRELALRRTADHVDDDVRAYRQERRIEQVWRTKEAVVACLGAGSDPDHVVRGAHRLAERLDCSLHVVTIESASLFPGSHERQKLLDNALALADTLGATTEKLAGADKVDAIVQYVRRHNISKAVLGRTEALASAHPWWRPRSLLNTFASPAGLWRRQSFGDALSQQCPELDVLRLAAQSEMGTLGEREGRGRTLAASAPSGAPLGRIWGAYLWTSAYCAVAAGVAQLAFAALHPTNIVMLFLLAVVAAALRHGRGPAAWAAVLSVVVFDYFFVAPLHSLAVSDFQYLVTFVVLLLVGLLIGQLMARMRQQAANSVKREREARGLYEFARDLSKSLQTEQIVRSTESFVLAAFGARCALFILGPDDRLEQAQGLPDDTAPLDPAVAQWVYDHAQPAGAGTATLAASAWLYLPLSAPMRTRGVLAVEVPRAPFAYADVRAQIDAYASLIAIALERVHYVDIAQQALLSMESEKLRNALLATISHDLRTPLTSLVGMSDTLLRAQPPLDPQHGAVVTGMRTQARRMHAMVVNLLYMARLQNHDVGMKVGWQSMEELVGAGLADMREALAAHRVVVAPMSALPLVECDAVLIERVICNLLENAAKYSPIGGEIRIGATVDDKVMHVSVADDGPGVPPGMAKTIFKKFTRGLTESATPGVGLGLAVCEVIMTLHGGTIEVRPESRAGANPGGACFVFTLPLSPQPAPPPQ
jgi:two-component system sensor histidine kinase KdpD